jgi:tryptophan synthase alpha chain
VEQIRRITGKKVAVGFGISRREHVTQVASFADGVVIGSALVRVVEETGDRHDLASRIERKARELLGT